MNIGMIGIGNMGTAIVKGYLAADSDAAKNIYAFDKDQEKLEAMASELGIGRCRSIGQVVERADVVIIAVKPGIFEQVLPEIDKSVKLRTILVSIAAGVSIKFIQQYISAKGAKIVRVMPNTPAMVNEGMTAVCRNANVTDQEFETIMELFRTVGKAEAVEEELMDTVIGVSGSSPAYAYMFVEALINSAVAHGMKKEQAATFAAQSLLGAAKMVLETGVDPATLKENVCSPGGTTIEAVKALENNGFYSNITEAFNAAVEKSKKITK